MYDWEFTSTSQKYWSEIQAINTSGVNIAKGITPTGSLYTTSGIGTSVTVTNASYLTDGDITTEKYNSITTAGEYCVVIDLGSTNKLNEISMWNFWNKTIAYENLRLQVSSNATSWTNLYYVSGIGSVANPNGIRYSAFR